jgi:CBS domain containing-hemolysin-like protein
VGTVERNHDDEEDVVGNGVGDPMIPDANVRLRSAQELVVVAFDARDSGYACRED